MKFDLNTQKEKAEKGFDLIPEGTHLMVCSAVEFTEVNGKPAWKVRLEVAPGEENAGMEARDTVFFTEKALVRVYMFLSAFGATEKQLSAIDPEDPKCQEIPAGRTALVTVYHQPDQKDPKRLWPNVTFDGYKANTEENRKAASSSGGDATPATGGGSPAEDEEIPF